MPAINRFASCVVAPRRALREWQPTVPGQNIDQTRAVNPPARSTAIRAAAPRLGQAATQGTIFHPALCLIRAGKFKGVRRGAHLTPCHPSTSQSRAMPSAPIPHHCAGTASPATARKHSRTART